MKAVICLSVVFLCLGLGNALPTVSTTTGKGDESTMAAETASSTTSPLPEDSEAPSDSDMTSSDDQPTPKTDEVETDDPSKIVKNNKYEVSLKTTADKDGKKMDIGGMPAMMKTMSTHYKIHPVMEDGTDKSSSSEEDVEGDFSVVAIRISPSGDDETGDMSQATAESKPEAKLDDKGVKMEENPTPVQ